MGKPCINGRNSYRRKKHFRVVEHIWIEEIQEQSHGYFGLIGIGNDIDNITSPLRVSPLTHLFDNDGTQANEIHNVYDRVRSDMIVKAIKGSTKKTSLKILRLHCMEYEWIDTGGLIINDGPTMLYLISKSIIPDTIIVVLNLKNEIEKATQA